MRGALGADTFERDFLMGYDKTGRKDEIALTIVV
jgi:hypothetical protein